MEVSPYSSALGAEVMGVNLAEPLSDGLAVDLHEALLTHKVLFVREQRLTPAQQVRFSRQLGELERYPFSDGLAEEPEITEVVKLPDEYLNFGSGWHVDMSFAPRSPDGAALYAIEVPPAGGDTLFCNLALALRTLSPAYRTLLTRLHGIHDSDARLGVGGELRGMRMRSNRGRVTSVQPLVRVHPETAEQSLFISPDYLQQLEDMTAEESAVLLDFLERHATRHEFTCRFRWSPRTLVLWDNRCIMHCAIEDDLGARLEGSGFRRVLHRTTFKRFFSTPELRDPVGR